MRKLPLVTDSRYYVSLGDAQSRNAESYLGAASLFYNQIRGVDFGLKMVPLATDGATAATIRYVQLPRFQEMHITPSVVTITLGASELSRLAFGESERVCRELRDHMGAVFIELRLIAPRCIMLFSTLYDPMDGAETNLRGGVQQYNETVRDLAATFGGTAVDVFAIFDGHGASAGDPLSPPGTPVSPDLYLCAGPDLSPVPNATGAAVLAERLAESYRSAVSDTPILAPD